MNKSKRQELAKELRGRIGEGVSCVEANACHNSSPAFLRFQAATGVQAEHKVPTIAGQITANCPRLLRCYGIINWHFRFSFCNFAQRNVDQKLQTRKIL